MDRTKGIACCGLACCVCSENTTCVGCREGGCKENDFCKALHCSRKKNIQGCWECNEYPCGYFMLKKVRSQAFIKYIKANGTDALIDALEANEKKGVEYHYKGKLHGDYDVPQTIDEIIDMLK